MSANKILTASKRSAILSAFLESRSNIVGQDVVQQTLRFFQFHMQQVKGSIILAGEVLQQHEGHCRHGGHKEDHIGNEPSNGFPASRKKKRAYRTGEGPEKHGTGVAEYSTAFGCCRK